MRAPRGHARSGKKWLARYTASPVVLGSSLFFFFLWGSTPLLLKPPRVEEQTRLLTLHEVPGPHDPEAGTAVHSTTSVVDGAFRDVPASPLYIVTPCSRPAYLSRIRATLPNEFSWVWIIVYTANPPALQFPGEANRVYEVWPGLRSASVEPSDEPRTFGNPERNFGISLIPDGARASYVYFLDDDNAMHLQFWRQIYPLLLMKNGHDFITFDQERTPGWTFPGAVAKVYKIDTAMYVTRRALIGDVRWRTLRYNADGYFAEEMSALSQRRAYIPCTCSYYNFFKQNFTTIR